MVSVTSTCGVAVFLATSVVAASPTVLPLADAIGFTVRSQLVSLEESEGASALQVSTHWSASLLLHNLYIFRDFTNILYYEFEFVAILYSCVHFVNVRVLTDLVKLSADGLLDKVGRSRSAISTYLCSELILSTTSTTLNLRRLVASAVGALAFKSDVNSTLQWRSQTCHTKVEYSTHTHTHTISLCHADSLSLAHTHTHTHTHKRTTLDRVADARMGRDVLWSKQRHRVYQPNRPSVWKYYVLPCDKLHFG